MSTDWDSKTVIGTKTRGGQSVGQGGSSAYDTAKKVGAIKENDRKAAAGQNKSHSGPDHQRIAKLDRENEVAPPPKVSADVGKTMMKARQEKGLTQKDLGTRINEKPQVIGDYEAGRAVPNPQILGKLERALGVKLRGKDIGLPLGGPKKK